MVATGHSLEDSKLFVSVMDGISVAEVYEEVRYF